MSKVLFEKIKESLISVLPVTAIVFLLNLTPLVDFSSFEIVVFLISTVFLILGIGLFNLGADLAMTPMGEHIGSGLTKSKSMTLLLTVCLAMGVFITVAEPDLTVLANQVSAVINPTLLIFTVGAGVGIFLLLSVVKILTKKPLPMILMFFYMLLFALTALVVVHENNDFLAMAFDSGGVTTGPITVPFIMALGVGIAATIGGKNVSENSFGLVAMCSIGPILAVMLLGVFAKGDITYSAPVYSMDSSGISDIILHTLFDKALDVLLALGLIVAFFAALQIFCLKLPVKKLFQIGVGILYTFVGLVVFLSAVEIGFMPIGYKLGTELASKHPKLLTICGTNDVIASTLIGFIGICFTVFSLLANRSIGASIGLYVFGLLFGISAMLGFFSTLLDLTAFKDNKIIVKRLFVTKEIPLTRIQRINCFKGNIHFFTISKNNKYKTLFTIDASAKNATEFVHIIDKN